MSNKLIDLSEPQQITSGIVKSLHPLQVPLWIDGQNVIFEDGQARKAPGYQTFFNTTSMNPITGMVDVLSGGKANLLFGDIESLYRWNGEERTEEATGFTASLNLGAFQENAWQETAVQLNAQRLASQWSMENWGQWCLATNGIDPIQINKLSGTGFVNLTGSPPTFTRILCRLKNFMLAFNTDLGGEWFEWCDLDDVEEWDPNAGSLAAGGLPIRDLDSEIIAAERLGDVIGGYSNNTMFIVQYVGAPYYFGAQRVLEGIGAVSTLCVVEREKTHYGLSKQGFWQTDGTQYNYISPPLLREWLDKNIDWANASKVAGALNEQRSLIEWGIPVLGGGGNVNLTISYNFTNGAWSFRPYGMTSGIKKGIFDFPIYGLEDGRVIYGETGLNADGVAQEVWLQTKPFALSEYLHTFTLDYMLAAFKNLAGTGVRVYLGIQQDLDDAITWSDPLEPEQKLLPMFVDGLDGRFCSIKIVSDGLDDDFWLAGMQVFGVMTGSYA